MVSLRAATGVVFGLLVALADLPRAWAEPEHRPTIVDRVVARWRLTVPGARGRTRAIFERELAFDARLDGLASGLEPGAPIGDRALRVALGRRVATELLDALPLDDPPPPRAIGERAELLRALLAARVGGEARLVSAMIEEGLGVAEVDTWLRRSARAAFVIEQTQGRSLEPTDDELRELASSERARGVRDDEARSLEALRAHVVLRRLADALDAVYQRARPRLSIRWSAWLPSESSP
jgi:hypothetical protein